MFGKGGGALNAWIKEFCELVFIQTLQAFIFALVISFILNIMTHQTTMDQTDRNTALGIICIVALTSIFKVEEIARRIFGYGPTKADHGNAVQSIGKSMMALKMGKNVLDNGKKIVSGAGAFIGSHKQQLKAKKRMQARLNALDKDNGGDESDEKPRTTTVTNNSNSGSAANKSTQPRKIDAAKRDQKLKLLEDAQKARKLASEEKDEKKREALKAEAKLKLEQSRAIDDTLYEKPSKTVATNANTTKSRAIDDTLYEKPSKTVATNANTTKSSGGRIKDYNSKKLQILEDYEAQKDKIEEKKRNGLKTMISGVAETNAAMVGFTAGTAMSVASTNDWGSAVKDGITWAGTADAVTAGAVDLGFSAEKFVENRVKNAASMTKEYGENVAKALNEYVSSASAADAQITKQTQQKMDDMKESAEKVAEKAGSSSDNKKPSQVKLAAKSLIKGFKYTYSAHSLGAQQKVIDNTIARLDKKNSISKPGYVDKDTLQ